MGLTAVSGGAVFCFFSNFFANPCIFLKTYSILRD
jgi:hypothetical protein